jgi:mannose-6-phosphate isomerase-like protein (cupin superfamily)
MTSGSGKKGRRRRTGHGADHHRGHTVPAWIGNTPFSPSEKRPCRITEDMEVSFLYGFEGTQVENRVFASTDRVFVGEWTLPPGSHYEPAGYHLHGDECYYLLEGDALAFNAETGETFAFHAGDAMLIPRKTRHQIFNMSTQRVVAVSSVAPTIWAPDGMGTIIPQVESPRFYKSPGEPAHRGALKKAFVPERLKRSVDSLGSWPAPGPALRELKQLLIIKPEDQLALIHGKERHVLFSFIVSNDYMHLALLKVPVAGVSEFETHGGDEVIDLLEGELCVRIRDSADERSDDATYPHFRLGAREKMIIPEGVEHQYMNFTNAAVTAFVAVAPRL